MLASHRHKVGCSVFAVLTDVNVCATFGRILYAPLTECHLLYIF